MTEPNSSKHPFYSVFAVCLLVLLYVGSYVFAESRRKIQVAGSQRYRRVPSYSLFGRWYSGSSIVGRFYAPLQFADERFIRLKYWRRTYPRKNPSAPSAQHSPSTPEESQRVVSVALCRSQSLVFSEGAEQAPSARPSHLL